MPHRSSRLRACTAGRRTNRLHRFRLRCLGLDGRGQMARRQHDELRVGVSARQARQGRLQRRHQPLGRRRGAVAEDDNHPRHRPRHPLVDDPHGCEFAADRRLLLFVEDGLKAQLLAQPEQRVARCRVETVYPQFAHHIERDRIGRRVGDCLQRLILVQRPFLRCFLPHRIRLLHRLKVDQNTNPRRECRHRHRVAWGQFRLNPIEPGPQRLAAASLTCQDRRVGQGSGCCRSEHHRSQQARCGLPTKQNQPYRDEVKQQRQSRHGPTPVASLRPPLPLDCIHPSDRDQQQTDSYRRRLGTCEPTQTTGARKRRGRGEGRQPQRGNRDRASDPWRVATPPAGARGPGQREAKRTMEQTEGRCPQHEAGRCPRGSGDRQRRGPRQRGSEEPRDRQMPAPKTKRPLAKREQQRRSGDGRRQRPEHREQRGPAPNQG